MDLKKKQTLRQKRIWRIRKKVRGTGERPRLCIHFSHKHIYAQAIDDVAGVTLLYLSTLGKEVRDENIKPNVEGARKLGEMFGKKAKEAGITRAVFDRHGRLFHGAVKAFAEATRKTGLEF